MQNKPVNEVKKINRNDPISIYSQLEEILKSEIINKFRKDEKFYSERYIEKKFNVSRGTAERSILNLVREGLLERKCRRGTFVKKSEKQETDFFKINQENIYFPYLGLRKKPVKLNVVFADPIPEQRKATEQIIEKFQQSNPDIIIEPIYDYENILLNFDSIGKIPYDIIQTVDLQIFYKIYPEMLLDLSLFLKEEPINFNDFLPQARKRCFINGRVLGLPYSLTLSLIFANKDLISKSKMNFPERFNTWDDYFKFCVKVSEGLGREFPDKELYATVFYELFYYFFSTPEAKKFSNNNFKKPFGELVKPLIEVFIKYKDEAFPISNIFELTENKINLFCDGKIALICGFTSNIPFIRERANFQCEIIAVPYYSNLVLMMNSISSSTIYPEESWEFVKFLSSIKAQSIYAKGWNNVPALKKAVFSSNYLGKFNKVIKDTLRDSYYFFNIIDNKNLYFYENLIYKKVEDLIKGRTSLDKTIKSLNEIGSKIKSVVNR